MTDKKNKLEAIPIMGNPDNNIPKFCTFVNFGVMKNKNVVITFTYNEDNGPHTLIERILVDFDHAKKISDVLKKVIEKVEKGD